MATSENGPLAQDFLPARRLPLLYFGFSHLSLAAAFAILAFAAERVLGFFYQPRMFAAAHLVTLGWISGSILGSIYLVAPLALRLPLKATWRDQLAFALFAVGVAGMVSHFWIDRPLGMVWAAPLPLLGFAHVAVRLFRGLPRAPIPADVRLLVGLAFANILLAGSLGLFLGVNKIYALAPVAAFAGVVAHAHLAAVGFATMMVMGAGQRLLPMYLPAAMPRGRMGYAIAILTQSGLLGLALELVLRGETSLLWPALIAAGVLLFLARIAWMLRHPRPAPAELPRPDWGMAHALQALLYLLIAVGLGLFLVVAPASESSLRMGEVYGVVGLVGFLAQIVVGVESRLLPMAAWLWSFAGGGYKELPFSLHRTPVRTLQMLGFALWTIGVPLLAAGFYEEKPAFVSTAGALLLLAVIGDTANAVFVLIRSQARTPPPGA